MANEGASIFSLSGGTVSLVQANHNDFGNWIIIQNGGLYYAYAHLKEVPDFSVGDAISMYDIIGEVGDTGNPPDGEFHLHLEIKEQAFSGQTYNASEGKNPEDYLGTNFDSNGDVIENNEC